MLYSSGKKEKPGPKRPSVELIQAIVKLKQRNPRFGCLRIAQQINKAFETDIDKDLVRRIEWQQPALLRVDVSEYAKRLAREHINYLAVVLKLANC
jgi:hypothetical protein